MTLALSSPIPNTPVMWTVSTIIGGDNRFGIKQDTRLAGSFSLVI